MADPYFSEIRYQSNNADFLEIAVDRDASVQNFVITLYDDDGLVISTFSLVGLTPTLIGGKDVYVIDSLTLPDLKRGDGVSLSETDPITGATIAVYSFLSFNAGTPALVAQNGPAAGMQAQDLARTGGNKSVESNDGGATYTIVTPNPGVIPCLTLGTHIQTPTGLVKIEDLQRGQHVTTLLGKSEPLLAIFRKTLTELELLQNGNLYPVRITAGALGKGLPTVDLLVSRQHRILVTSAIAQRMFNVPEVLVAAIRLVELPGIYVDTSAKQVTYFHLLFDAHEVIYAEGAPTESLFLGAEAIKSLPGATLTEIATIFPDLVLRLENATASRLIPPGSQQKALVARHAANQKAILADLNVS